ncbi:hypothetical protein ACJMK2_043816 [Sinanodonta woodiana]|uniref:Uncharacterized protein n=1 Tax=Sinanodonta woodiana TaxID=1069815 RepID=A0ABD3VZT8_SINWO
MEHLQLLILTASYLVSATLGQECTFQFHVPYNRENFQCGNQHDLRLTNDLSRVQSQLELEGSRNTAIMEAFKKELTTLDSDVKSTASELSKVSKNVAVFQRDIEGIKSVENDVDAMKWILMNVSQSFPQQVLNLQAKMMDIVKGFQDENKRQTLRFTSLENMMENVNETLEKVSDENAKQSSTVKELSGEVAGVIGKLQEAPPAPERVLSLQQQLTELQQSYQKSIGTLQAQIENLMLQVRVLQTRIDERE